MPDFEEEEQSGEEQSVRPFWSGTITFGLVSIPVSLFPANRQNRVSLRMLSAKGKPLARRYYAPATGRELSSDQMVRGYEFEKNKYIIVTDDELERLAPEKSRDIDLRRFVQASAIPPMYFERAYFLVPAGGSAKAYRLLGATMEETDRAGIATFVMRGKEYLVAILAENGILRAETLRFSDEIRSPEDVGLPEAASAPAPAVRKFGSAISKLKSDDISKQEMTDKSLERMHQLAEKKQSRRKDVVKVGGGGKGAEVVDILTILQRSLGQLSSGSDDESPDAGPRKRTAKPGATQSGKVQSAKPESEKPQTAKPKLQDHSKSELLAKAKALNVPGRSGMNKDELIKAIERVA